MDANEEIQDRCSGRLPNAARADVSRVAENLNDIRHYRHAFRQYPPKWILFQIARYPGAK
jgi:hypothetical protein